MMTRFKNSMRNISSLIFTKENATCITASFILTGTGIGFNFLTPYVFSKAVISLITRESVVVLGMELSPLAAVGAYNACAALSSLNSTLRGLIAAPLNPQTTKKLIVRYVHHVMEQSLNTHTSTPAGYHNGLVAKCYMSVPSISGTLFDQIIPTILEMSISLGAVFRLYDYRIGLGLGSMLVSYLTYSVATKNKIADLRQKMVDRWLKTQADITETIALYQAYQEFSNVPLAMQRLKDSLSESKNTEIKAIEIISKINMGQILISNIGMAGLSLLIAKDVLSGRWPLADFLMASSYLTQFAGSLSGFGFAVNNGLASLTELQAVFDELEKISEVVDWSPTRLLHVDHHNATIEFKNVSFHYTEGTPILENVSFTIPAGKKIGIVGISGSGKSTIANLLFRFYDPTSGNIYINGENIKDVGLRSLRSHFGIVSQNPVLFNDTLYNNIAFGRAYGDDCSPHDVNAAIKAACLTHYVDSLPEKTATQVGERGAKISGGQRQRVAIARAFLKNPNIYIFDEATSALDSHVEREIQSNIDSISKGVTSIHITHRLANLDNVDHIIVLSEGHVVEQGTHQELIKNSDGVYARLWREQHVPATAIQEIKSPDCLLDKVSEKKSDVVRSASSRDAFFKPAATPHPHLEAKQAHAISMEDVPTAVAPQKSWCVIV